MCIIQVNPKFWTEIIFQFRLFFTQFGFGFKFEKKSIFGFGFHIKKSITQKNRIILSQITNCPYNLIPKSNLMAIIHSLIYLDPSLSLNVNAAWPEPLSLSNPITFLLFPLRLEVSKPTINSVSCLFWQIFSSTEIARLVDY